MAKHLVAKYGGKGAEDLFAAMAPLELVKALLVKAVQRKDRRKKLRKLMFIDVSKARLYAPVGPDVKPYVDLPPECGKSGVCGLLQFWLYGMRPASHGWQEEYVKQLGILGFKCGEASPWCFHCESDDVSCVVHGDDFTFEGPPGALKEVAAALQRVWLVKEQDMTNEGCPVAQPRLSRRPLARTMIPWPSGNSKRSTCGLMFSTLMPGKPSRPAMAISLLK